MQWQLDRRMARERRRACYSLVSSIKDIVGESFIEGDADDQQKGDRNAMSDSKQMQTKIDTKFERPTETDSKETHTHADTQTKIRHRRTHAHTRTHTVHRQTPHARTHKQNTKRKTHTRTHTQAQTHTHTKRKTHTRTHTQAQTHTHTKRKTHTRTHTQAQTHTHTQTKRQTRDAQTDTQTDTRTPHTLTAKSSLSWPPRQSEGGWSSWPKHVAEKCFYMCCYPLMHLGWEIRSIHATTACAKAISSFFHCRRIQNSWL